MIGTVRPSASLRRFLHYCLKDKLSPARDGEERTVEFKQRAEIIHFNQCYGNRQELVNQFRDVVQLNHNICKPYLHVMLGLPPQDRLSNSQLADVSAGCAKALGFEDHQYLAILHKDTEHQHVHLLVNRIGFDGDVVHDKCLFARISQFCRQTERDYHLTQTPGPRRYQTQEQRQQERQDPRVIHLRQSIAEALKTACSYPVFEEQMQNQGYKVYRNENGIAFFGEKTILRGHEAGYPWKKIENTLEQNEVLRQEKEQQKEPKHWQKLIDEAEKRHRQSWLQELREPSRTLDQKEQSQEHKEEESLRQGYRQRIRF